MNKEEKDKLDEIHKEVSNLEEQEVSNATEGLKMLFYIAMAAYGIYLIFS